MAKTKTIPGNLVPVDTEVDRTFGEPVILKPMKQVQGGYREPVPDPDRVEVVARGIYDQGRGLVEMTGGGLQHKQATVDTSLSIRHEPLDACSLVKGDRVFFPDRGEMHEVTWISDDPGGRPDVHLVRVLE
jgi:hypothetical protein